VQFKKRIVQRIRETAGMKTDQALLNRLTGAVPAHG
jgi:hypothetical protein